MANQDKYTSKLFLTGKEPYPEIIDHIKTKVAIYNEQNKPTYRQWLLNTAFARGQQWGAIGKQSNVFESLTPPSGLNYVIDDMIGPWKKATVANLSIGRPEWEAVPKSLAFDAIMAARMANDILDAFWDEWRFTEKEIESNGFLVDFANFLIFIRYNEDEVAGEIVFNSDTDEPIFDDDGNPVRSLVKIGKISADIRPPHHLGCPLDPRDLDEKEWIFWQQSRPLGYFPIKYGKLGENVVPDNQQDTHEGVLDFISRGRKDDLREDSANEVLFMQKPNEICPDGLFVPYVSEQLLEKDRDKWRWQFDDMTGYPVIHVHGPKTAGEFWARSSIESQIPLQRALNIVVSSMVDNVDNMAHMKWGIPASSGVADIWNTSEVIPFEGNQPPAMLEVKGLPLWISDERTSLKASIRDIQSWHGASQGGAVVGVRSDLHAQNLQDQDMLPYTTLDNLKAAGYARMGDKILRIRAEKMPDQAMSFIRDGRPRVINNFRTVMMDSIARLNVKMVGTGMRSKGMVKQEIAQWYQAGLLVDPITGQPDARKATELLEFTLPNSMFEQLRIHSNQAFIENTRMYDGEAPKPYGFENHFIHQRVHGDEMNSPRFRQLLEAAEAKDVDAIRIVKLFYGHIDMTSKLQKQAFAQLAPPPEERTQEQGTKQETKQGTKQGTKQETSQQRQLAK